MHTYIYDKLHIYVHDVYLHVHNKIYVNIHIYNKKMDSKWHFLKNHTI
jgi:hypothetical protein